MAALKPVNVLPLEDMPINVRVCSIHENVFSLVTALKLDDRLPFSDRTLIDAVCCSRSNDSCMNMVKDRSCAACNHIRECYTSHGINMSKKVAFSQWKITEK